MQMYSLALVSLAFSAGTLLSKALWKKTMWASKYSSTSALVSTVLRMCTDSQAMSARLMPRCSNVTRWSLGL